MLPKTESFSSTTQNSAAGEKRKVSLNPTFMFKKTLAPANK
jgi:hypothetical protein